MARKGEGSDVKGTSGFGKQFFGWLFGEDWSEGKGVKRRKEEKVQFLGN